MPSEPKPYKEGLWVGRGTILGAFIGLLVDKFAIGLIFGFFIGIMIDSAKRNASRAQGGGPADGDAKE